MTLAGPIAQAALAGFAFVAKAAVEDLRDAYVMNGQWIHRHSNPGWSEAERPSKEARADIEIQLERFAGVAVDFVYDYAYLFTVVAEELLFCRELSRNQIGSIVEEFSCSAHLDTADLEAKLPRQRFAKKVISEVLKPGISGLCGRRDTNDRPGQ